MYKRILVPVDGSSTADKALVAGLQLAREADGCVRVVHAFDELTFVSGDIYDGQAMRAARAEAGTLLQRAMDAAASAGVPADSQLIEARGRRLGDAIGDEATEWKADLVVVGTHGRRGLSRALLGSGAEQVIRMAPVPVLVVREAPSRS